MKKYLILIFFASIFWGCSDKGTVNKDIPGWLQVKVNEIKNGKDAMLYRISEYSINQEIYYDIRLSYQSCVFCDMYDKQGNKAQVSLDQNTEIKHIRTIWPEIK